MNCRFCRHPEKEITVFLSHTEGDVDKYVMIGAISRIQDAEEDPEDRLKT